MLHSACSFANRVVQVTKGDIVEHCHIEITNSQQKRVSTAKYSVLLRSNDCLRKDVYDFGSREFNL